MQSRKDVCYEEATSNPIFLFQRKLGRQWDTERVFFSRAEGEDFGRAHDYNYRTGWRVYCVPCDGQLATVLNDYAALPLQTAPTADLAAIRDRVRQFSELAGGKAIPRTFYYIPDVTALLAEVDRLRNENERLAEALREDREKWSFETALFVGALLLKKVYPASVFTGASGDIGPQYVAALRNALKNYEQVTANVSALSEIESSARAYQKTYYSHSEHRAECPICSRGETCSTSGSLWRVMVDAKAALFDALNKSATP